MADNARAAKPFLRSALEQRGKAMIRVLFVCMGNICRSPLAQGAFEALVDSRGLRDHFLIDSAGTIGFHSGKAPDSRSIKAANARGIDISQQRSRKIHPDDIEDFDYILVMDEENLRDVKSVAGLTPDQSLSAVQRLLDFSPHMPLKDVPDPYQGHERDFEDVLRAVEDACEGLLAHIEKIHDLS